MKTIAVAGMLALVVYLAYVSASMEMGYIESSKSCNYVRNYQTGEKSCLESSPVPKWSLITENSPKCAQTQGGCELKNK